MKRTRTRTREYTVKQGEWLGSIARAFKLPDGDAIYQHPENATFRADHPHDPYVLHPGDQLRIPEMTPKWETGQTERRHSFRLKRRQEVLRLCIRDEDGEPFRNAFCQAEADDRILDEKPTDGEGMFETLLPPGTTRVQLTLPDHDLAWELDVGRLDPVRREGEGSRRPTITGVQARLNNLGFRCGPIDGVFGPRTQAALQSFERVVLKRSKPRGDLDDKTLDALRDGHGC